jgi:6-phosphogluconolactonase
MSLPPTRIFADSGMLVDALATALLEVASCAIVEHGRFDLVLAGGLTPRALYAELARRGAGNTSWFIWYGDERCLPPDNPERNSYMAESVWLSSSAIPLPQRRAIPVELGCETAVRQYSAWLETITEFDLVLLGMGKDGHTASLFPGRNWGVTIDAPSVLIVRDAPKPPQNRVSMSVCRLSHSKRVWFLVTGSEKREAVARWQAGKRLPVAAISGSCETVLWIEAAAAP